MQVQSREVDITHLAPPWRPTPGLTGASIDQPVNSTAGVQVRESRSRRVAPQAATPVGGQAAAR